jgi:hypothetical protein
MRVCHPDRYHDRWYLYGHSERDHVHFGSKEKTQSAQTTPFMIITHVCFQDRMRYNPHDDYYCCAVCGKRYRPPQKSVANEAGKWKPWQMPIMIPIFFEWEVYWYPWKVYPWRLFR